jgi:hypothetical protein
MTDDELIAQAQRDFEIFSDGGSPEAIENSKRLIALARRGAAVKWRPIEEAPKDGTEMIVSHPIAGVCAAFCPGDGFAWHCMDGQNTVVGAKSGKSIPSMTSFLEPPTRFIPLSALGEPET